MVDAPVRIHPQAIVDRNADLDSGVVVGPWCLIGPGVKIGAGTVLGPSVLVERDTTVGRECRIEKGAVLGTDPQDLKYAGEETVLTIGDRTIIREYATLNRGTAASQRTAVGSDCLLMAYTHVAHDSVIGDHVILSNAVNMAGHVTIGDHAIIGGLTGIHQFVRIGSYAFIGGASRISQDVMPYCRVAGSPPKLYGLNTVGLERRGFAPEVRSALKHAYRTLFQSSLNMTRALAEARGHEGASYPEVERFLDFVEESERGVVF